MSKPTGPGFPLRNLPIQDRQEAATSNLALTLVGTTLPDGKEMFFVEPMYKVEYVSGNAVLVKSDE